MKRIDVACAIIEKNGRVLAAQRSETMLLPLKWEFPGGKVEPDESAAACLEREIAEELGVGVVILESLPPSDWCYPYASITLHPFVCTINGGKIRLLEHKEVRWLAPEELRGLDWADADGPVLRSYFDFLARRNGSKG